VRLPWRCRRSSATRPCWRLFAVALVMLIRTASVAASGAGAECPWPWLRLRHPAFVKLENNIASAFAVFTPGPSQRTWPKQGITAKLASTLALSHLPARLPCIPCRALGGRSSEAGNGTSPTNDLADDTSFSDLAQELESGELWDRPIMSNTEGGVAVVGLLVLVWAVNACRLVFDFFRARELGGSALERFQWGFVVKAFVVTALIAVIGVVLNFSRPLGGDQDGSSPSEDPWEDFWTSDYWNEPVAFDPLFVFLGFVGGFLALLASSAFLARGVRFVNDMSLQNLPELSLGQGSL